MFGFIVKHRHWTLKQQGYIPTFFLLKKKAFNFDIHNGYDVLPAGTVDTFTFQCPILPMSLKQNLNDFCFFFPYIFL